MLALALTVVLAQAPPPPTAPAPPPGPPLLARFAADAGRIVHEVTESVPVARQVTVTVPVTQERNGVPFTVTRQEVRTVVGYQTNVRRAPVDPKGAEFRTAGGTRLSYQQAAARLAGGRACVLVFADPAPDDPYLKLFRDDVLVVRLPAPDVPAPTPLPAPPVPGG